MRFFFCLILTTVALFGEEKFRPSPMTNTGEFSKRSWSKDEGPEMEGFFREATRYLMELDFPDPFGLPYYAVTLPSGSCWSGDSGVVSTCGWLLPTVNETAQRFVIAWNGLIYPVIELGELVNFAAWYKEREENFPDTDNWSPSQNGERDDLELRQAQLLQGVLLCRLGFYHEADALLGKLPETPDLTKLGAWSLESWAWNLFDRAVCAHQRRDHVLALEDWREFSSLKPALMRLPNYDNPHGNGIKQWARQSEVLLKESERIAGRLVFDEKEYLERDPSVPELIEALDEVIVFQSGQPARIYLGASKIVAALIAKREEAVDQLLVCLETDKRFTRSVHFWRDFANTRVVLSVREAALCALCTIYDTDFRGGHSPGANLTGRGEQVFLNAAKEAREFRANYAAEDPVMRSFQVMKDEEASLGLFLSHAVTLVDFECLNSNMAMREAPGEKLREKQEPSVKALIESRINACLDHPEKMGDNEFGQVLALMQVLWLWDQEAGEKVIGRLHSELESLRAGSYMFIERLGYEFSPRMALRSESAFQIFCALVEFYPPAKDKEWMFISGATRLMIKGKDNEKMRMLMDRLFSGEDSLWNPSRMSGDTFERFMSHCFDSKRILKVPEMKVALLRVLDDQTHLGTLTIREESPESFTYVFEEGERNARIEDDLAHNFTIGQERELRRCDLAAHMFARVLAGRKKGPELQYHLLWSDEQRTAGLERLIQSVMD